MLSIIEVPDPRLRLKSTPVDMFDAGLVKLTEDMFAAMYAAPGIGLAAIQVAVPTRVVVMDLRDGPEETANKRVFVNPEVTWASDEWAVYNEGCLSIPEMYADIERPARVRATWRDVGGAVHEAEFDGLLATCLQHEIDHLNGVLFIDHLSRLKRDLLLKKLTKIRKEKTAA